MYGCDATKYLKRVVASFFMNSKRLRWTKPYPKDEVSLIDIRGKSLKFSKPRTSQIN